MYFKRLELFGFKSFADKTKLTFEPGVTAVVGPNGCGKSNIADSVKWVLGEQSAKELRGARMEDVIFNGTASREPINMAEVSLVLSNKDKVLPIDYDEVIITRRLFRSGESEYLINKMPVRLKDINDLLSGTGIGTSSYSMIEQGRIGLILSSKPEERRHLLEEASGITKYKSKKKEALRKLEHTENNLIRLNDIVNEVERQIKSIERQARKAEKYKNDFEVLKEMDLKYSSFKYRDIVNELKTYDIESQVHKKRVEEMSECYVVLCQDVRNSRKLIDEINENQQKTQRDVSETNAEIDKNRHTAKIDKERIKELKEFSENLQAEKHILKEKSQNKKKRLEELESEFSAISSGKTLKENALHEYETIVSGLIADINLSQKKMRENKGRVMDILSSQTKAKNELIKLGAEIQGRKTRLRRLKIEEESVSKEKVNFDSKTADIKQRFKHAESGVSLNRDSLMGFKEKLCVIEESLRNIRQTISDSKRTLEVLKSKRDMLNELIEKHEGFGKSVKAIMEKCDGSKEGIKVRPVADIISIEPGFEQAVESVLGDLTNALVVDNYKDAHGLINFIKEKNIGRAHFLIVNSFMGGNYNTIDRIPEGSQEVRNVVRCHEGYRNILSYLFKDAFITDTTERADSLFSLYKECKFATKDGYLREGPRVFDGALIEAGTSVLGRKERVKEITARILLIDSGLEKEMLKEKEATVVLEEYKQKIGEGEKSLREAELFFANIESAKQAVIESMKRVDDEKTVLDAEIFEEEENIRSLRHRGETLNKELNQTEEEQNLVQNLIVSFEDSINEKAALKESTLLKIESTKGELSSIKVSCDNIVANLDLRKEECAEIEKDMKIRVQQLQHSLVRIEELSNEVLQVEADNQALIGTKKYIEAILVDLRDKKSKVIEDHDRKDLSRQEQEKEIEELRDTIRNLEIKLTESKFKKRSLSDRVQQAYRVDISLWNTEIEDGINWEEIKERISEIKQKLDKMGAVNLVAIEEHRELEERYSFLTRQKDDLVSAKDSLHKAIIKINVTTKKLFMETFEKVRVEFKSYFKMLFGGGQAEIFLLDERDVLESGIEIVVRPPGKKLQNILLLSGGEKALTAIALLFAVFKVNPSPFCILDEIDAPLDETNIDRFTRVLQEFLKMSQFIIITHNKKTIQMADVLYGITMAQRGVSRIVSVKFDENEQEETVKEEVMV